MALLLARNEHFAVAITSVTAYANGLEFNLAVRTRRSLDPSVRRKVLGKFMVDEGVPSERLRLGVQFSDGRKATSLGVRQDRAETDPVLVERGGGGGGRSWDSRFWLWPLPTPGAIAFVTEWPLAGIDLTRVEVDAEPILQASLQARELWPEESDAPIESWTESTFTVGVRQTGESET